MEYMVNNRTFFSKKYLFFQFNDIIERLSVTVSKDEVCHLATRLNISSEEVKMTFGEHCIDYIPVREAIHDILKAWFKKQPNIKQAYDTLGNAMVHREVGLNLIAREILGYEPLKQDTFGHEPLKQDTSQTGYEPLKQDTSQAGYEPLKQDTSQTGYEPLKQDTSQAGYEPLKQDISQSEILSG